MRVEITVALLLGTLLSPFLPISIWAGMAAMFVLLLLSYFLFEKHIDTRFILLLSILVFGLTYPNLRAQLFSEDGSKPGVSECVQKAEESLCRTNLSADHQHLLGAMLLGDRQWLSDDQKALFRAAGAQHLLALSGFHLGILTVILSYLALRRVRFTRWRWPVLGVTLLLLWWYAVMVGMPKSLLRASIMYTLFMVGQFANRETRGYECLSSAVFLMLVIDPMSAYDVGAQLSVMAMVGITVYAPILVKSMEMRDSAGDYVPPRFPLLFQAWRYFCVSFSAWLFTMPLVIFYFRQMQLWQPLVSVFLMPFVSVVLYVAALLLLLALLGVGFLAEPLSCLVDTMMEWLDWGLQLSASLPLSVVGLQEVSVVYVVLLYAIFTIVAIPLVYRSGKVLLVSAVSCAFLFLVMFFLPEIQSVFIPTP